MKTPKVNVVPYDAAWQDDFKKIKNEIEVVAGDLILDIQHVGSTSVIGLCAKPCIDIDVVIGDYSIFEEVKSRLSNIGYIHEGDLGIKDREAFKYFDKPHLKSHHLYVCPIYSAELHRHIRFRDFLRENPEVMEKYANTKRAAAKLYPENIDKYIEHKSPCIEEIYRLCGLIE